MSMIFYLKLLLISLKSPLISSSSPKSLLFSPCFVPILDPPLIGSNTPLMSNHFLRNGEAERSRSESLEKEPSSQRMSLGLPAGEATRDEPVGVGGERKS
jgi:hypothetical protein